MSKKLNMTVKQYIIISNFWFYNSDRQIIKYRYRQLITYIIMNSQEESAINHKRSIPLNHQLVKVVSMHSAPKSLQRIIQIIMQLPGTGDQPSRLLQRVIDELSENIISLNNKAIKLDDYKKQQEFDSAFHKFVSFPHQAEMTISEKQQQVINKYRQVFTKYFHYFIHRTTLKNMTKLFVIFFKFLSLQLLEVQVVNLFFLVLVLAHQNLSPTNDLKYIKICMRSLYRNQIIYIGSSLNQIVNVGSDTPVVNKHLYKNCKLINLSFAIIAYVLFFGNIEKSSKSNEQNKAEDTKMIQKIISNPLQITSLILNFRNQFPKTQVQSCLRDLESLSTTIVDSYFLRSIIGVYLDYNFQPFYKQCTFYIIQNLVKFNLSQNTVKSMIKKLEISEYDNLQQQWKKVFQLLKTTLPQNTKVIKQNESQEHEYKIEEDSPKKQIDQDQLTIVTQENKQKPSIQKIVEQKNVIKFTNSSYLAFTLQHQFNGFLIVFKSYRILDQYILLKLVNQQQQIWVFVRHIQQTKFLLTLMKLVGGAPVEMMKQQIQWKPFDKHTLQSQLEDDKIVFKFGTQQNTHEYIRPEECQSARKIKKTMKIKNIKPKQIILGSKQKDIPVYPCQITNFEIKYCQGKTNYNFIFHNKNKMNLFSNSVKMQSTSSLTKILNKLGELDLFVLITSHLIRKVQNQQSLKNMLRQVISFLQSLVIFKGVTNVKLNQHQKQHRFYNIRSLIWLSSRYKRDPGIILQILKILCIRGIKKPLDHLQILSNIGLWKQIPSKKHVKVIQKIRQNCHLVPVQKSSQLLQMLKKIILDFILFYKDTILVSQALQQDYLLKRSQIMKLLYDIITIQKTYQIIDFVLFLLKILYLVLDKTKNYDYIDVTIGFQLTSLAYRLMYFARQDQYRLVLKQKISNAGKKIMKAPKNPGIQSAKTLNLPLRFMNVDRDHQSLILKIQQNLAWIYQIIYFLKKQVLIKQPKIKFYDWEWDFKHYVNSSSVYKLNTKSFQSQKPKTVSQAKILTMCQHIQIGLLSFNKQIFNQLVLQQLSKEQWEIYWHMNLFDEKICPERFIQTCKIGNFNSIVWDDSKVQSILRHSFDLIENGKPLKIPSKLLQNMKINDITNIHNVLLGIYLEKIQKQSDSISKQHCAQNIMFILAMLPDSLYSNTQLLRQQLNKQKRNNKTVYLIEKHLIVKQLSKQGFKLMSQLRNNQFKQLSSTILAFQEVNLQKNQNSETNQNQLKISFEQSEHQTLQVQSKNSKKSRGQTSDDFNVFCNIDVEYQQSFLENGPQNHKQTDNISTQKIKESLQHFKLLANPSQIAAFYKISSQKNKKQSDEQIQGLIFNFNINIDSIIKILQQQTNISEKINQLQSFIFFIQKHIYAFSKMIITQYLFTQINSQSDIMRQKRKKSYKQAGYKFKQQSQTIFQEFLKQRRKSVYRMQNIWVNIQKNNKDFWHIFFKSEKKNQTVDEVCSSMKLKGLVKIDCQKKQIQLPKNLTTISNKFSVSGDSDKQIITDSFIDNPHFGDIAMYQQQQSFEKDKDQCIKLGVPIHGKDLNNLLQNRKTKNQFLVLYITTTKIFQGIIKCGPAHIKFQQDKIPDESFYEIVCANENQKREVHEIEKRRQQFQILLNDKSTIIPKRYLYYDSAVEIYSQKLSYFFVFRKNAKRQQFLNSFQNLKGTISNQQQLIENANKQMERWVNGDISNFTYLMHLNDLAGRSFNDMSQYYVFPWILTNYKSQKFNKKFLNNEKNYRDLSKPVGALNKKRLDELLCRFKESMKYNQTQSYLYGSYCSNPAIVCNYLVRLQPFSMFHYLLQSKQFDLADRIFYSVLNQYNCSYNNLGDYKQLIPQFYSCPQFLRNRNKYKFGQKQNKEIVNNVQLPQWAHYQFNSNKKTRLLDKNPSFQAEEQFVFRMRKCLESAYVTANLNQWVDLIFGPYTQKQKAMERNNLYIPMIYKNELSKTKNNKNKQVCLLSFKQFGQLPRDLFDRDHKNYKNTKSYYKVGDSRLYQVSEINSQYKSRIYYDNDQYLICYDEQSIRIMQTKGKGSDHSFTTVPSSQNIKQLKQVNIQHMMQDRKCQIKLEILIYLKAGRLALRQLTFSTFRKKLEIKDEKECLNIIDTKFQILQIYQQQNQIILGYQSNYRIYSYKINNYNLQKSVELSNMLEMKGKGCQQQEIIIAVNKKLQFKLNLQYEFTNHKCKIQHMRICNSFGLLISIDSNRKVYVFKLKSKQREIIQFFRLKKFTHCQTIRQMEVHEMGYIILLTSLNNIHVYNFMGDHVAQFSGNTIRQINKKMKKRQMQKQQNKPNEQSNLVINRHQGSGRKKSANDIQIVQKVQSVEIQIQQSQFQGEGTAVNDDSQNSDLTSVSGQTVSNKNKKVESEQTLEIITTFRIWNHESGQLIVGTQMGNLYRFDLFMIDDCQKINLNSFSSKSKSKKEKDRKEKDNSKKQLEKKLSQIGNSDKIQHICINRIGRHWQSFVFSTQQLYKIQSQDYRNSFKRNEQYRKKYVLP